MATTVARLEAILGADTSGFDKAMSKSEDRLHGVRTAAGLAGAAIATGLGVVAKVGFDELKDAQRVTAQTNAVLKSTGGIAHVSAKQIDEMATSLLNKTGIDDETVKSGENLLLTFKNIRNEAGKGNDMFNQATKATLDLSVAFGKSVPQAAILVGKALNDPIKGLTALQRVGVTFTAQQREQIKALVASGQTMKAQKVIMAELNSETGGSAAAAGKTLQGQLNITKETFKNLAAQIVSAVLPAVTDFAKIVSRATTFLSEHQKVAKILFVALGALSVVLLTISASLKIATAATTIWSAATKLATAAQWLLNAALTANPIGVVIVALAALGVAMVLAYTKIKIFREGVQEAWTWIKDHWPLILGIMAGPVGLAVEQIIVHRNRLVQVFGALPGMIAGALGDLRAFFFHQIIDKFTGAIDDGVKAVKRAISNLFGKVIDWVKDVLGINSPSTVFHEMGRQSVQGFINGVGSMAGVLKKAVVGMVESLPSKALGAATGVIGAIPGAKGTIVGEGPKSGIHASPDLAKQFAVTQMKAFGWGPSQMAALEPLWNGESGWRWNALNRSSGAYGIPQSLPASKMATAGKDWHENAFTQILWGLRYIKDRYGSPSAAYGAWQSRSPHWYAKGGIIRRPMFAMMGEEGPEAIIPLSPNRKKEAAGILRQISPQVGLQSWQDKTLEFFKSLWNVAKPFYGGAAMPMLNFVEKGIDITRSFVSGPSHGPNTLGSRTVNWTHAASNALFGNKEWMRQWALDAALHEWVHIFQKPGVFGTPWKAEGGAVDFVRMMGKKIYSTLGIEYNPISVGGQYEGWATRVMKELGPTWVLRDQFRDPRAVAGLKSAVFDKGGWLQPGLTLAANNTGRPEPVGGGGNVTINYNGTIIHEREAEQRIVDLLARAQRRGPLGLSGGFA